MSEFRSKAKGLLMGRDIRPRPMSVSKEEFDASYERIFGKKPDLDERLLARSFVKQRPNFLPISEKLYKDLKEAGCPEEE